MKAILYRLNRWLIARIARPTRTGAVEPPEDREIVYALEHRSLTDLIMLDLVTEQSGLTSPHAPLSIGDFTEPKRFFSLFRAAGGRITMPSLPQRMQRLIEAPQAVKDRVVLIPVTVFWGRSISPEGSWLQLATSEHWAVTGRIKRALNLLLARKDIWVHTGRPIALAEVAPDDVEAGIALRRTARLLRVRFRQQRISTLGPDFSHRRTLVNQIVASRAVKDAIAQVVAEGEKPRRAERRAFKDAKTIASDMSYPTIRMLSRVLRWFWHKIYDGMDVSGLEKVEAYAGTHTLVYVPSHRSHLDYLVLSYLLFHRGIMIPHIAAGDNLNLPILGRILRRGGAFFMRRSFRDDPLYTAVFNEYLYQVYRRGHCVEFFPEGGRTRTGRLLPVKYGLLKTSLDHYDRGLPKPLAFVPVYIGYEKLAEGTSYLSELRGGGKRRESLLDVFRNLKLVRQDFGRVQVNFGAPLALDSWFKEHGCAGEERLPALSREIMLRINEAATVNPTNLIAAVTLATPKQSVEQQVLIDQVWVYQKLITELYGGDATTQQALAPVEAANYVEALGMLAREREEFGDVCFHDGFTAILMTWYLNNVIHRFALPALIAALVIRRRRPLPRERLTRMVGLVYPYLADELTARYEPGMLDRTVDALAALDLLVVEDGAVAAASEGTRQHQRLNLLANLVMQTLERMFIVVSLLRREEQTIETLRQSAQLIAHKISRIYGINAPEFFDPRLFDGFIEHMLADGVVTVGDDGTLGYEPIVDDVLRAAEFVIEPEIRYAVLSAAAPT